MPKKVCGADVHAKKQFTSASSMKTKTPTTQKRKTRPPEYQHLQNP